MVACFFLTRGGLLLAWLALPGSLLGDLVFRCPSCTAEQLAACPKVMAVCGEIVREPGCGCCPVCARLQGEPCGVYTPRCCTGQRCYPTAEAELPLQQLIQGLGRCGPRQEEEAAPADPPPKGYPCSPSVKREGPLLNKQLQACFQFNHLINNITKKPVPSCEQELNRVLEEISRMTLQENLYELRFPNCDRNGLYNLKQCNMSTHGQRGECWCVDPMTGTQLPATPRVRGDPNCNLLQEDPGTVPTAAAMR
uniref:Insulin-like growth factor binding protein 2b n=1 Tax=Gadus morhua TaxID=8049 RepID=A0A8C4Z0U6_GADMO